MTTLAEMRSEVARDHGWHEDDDGDRIDEVLNERFGQAAVEMYAALERAQKLLDRISRPKDDEKTNVNIITSSSSCQP